MATAKPASLSTNFLRSVRSCRPQTYHSIRCPPLASPCNSNISRKRKLHISSRYLQQEQGYQRYGPAATPSMPPPAKPGEPFLPSTEQTQQDATELEAKTAQRQERQVAEQPDEDEADVEPEEQSGKDKATQREAIEPHPEEIQQAQATSSPDETKPETSDQDHDQQQQSSGSMPQTSSSPSDQATPKVDDSPLPHRELDMVLSIPSPSEVKSDPSSSHPHLAASPYEHHFDTYTLVQDLCKPQTPPPTSANSSPDPVTPFTEAQSVTLMKSIRLMLASNLDLAKDSLVSKSDTENETYLFRAACSELKTTMQTSRFMEAQKQRSQRAQVQHEFDILNQKVSQDIMTMREELKGMFNDRKLGLQEEKRQTDGKIQGLSYRISVDLNSEAKSEVEGLRWVLTRRAALAIGAAASMVLAFLQYYSVKSREQAEIDKKRKAERQKQEERMKREEERFGNSGVTMGRSTGTQTDAILLGGAAGNESLG